MQGALGPSMSSVANLSGCVCVCGGVPTYQWSCSVANQASKCLARHGAFATTALFSTGDPRQRTDQRAFWRQQVHAIPFIPAKPVPQRLQRHLCNLVSSSLWGATGALARSELLDTTLDEPCACTKPPNSMTSCVICASKPQGEVRTQLLRDVRDGTVQAALTTMNK